MDAYARANRLSHELPIVEDDDVSALRGVSGKMVGVTREGGRYNGSAITECCGADDIGTCKSEGRNVCGSRVVDILCC